jgi:hypothetical protein
LVIDPVLVVGSKAGIENPLLKAEIAGRQVIRQRIPFWTTRVSRQVRNTGDDPAAPVLDDPHGLVFEHFPSETQVALGLLR